MLSLCSVYMYIYIHIYTDITLHHIVLHMNYVTASGPEGANINTSYTNM